MYILTVYIPVYCKGTTVNGLSVTSHTIGVDLSFPEAEQLRGCLDPDQPDISV
jgi:hypothetical protein